MFYLVYRSIASRLLTYEELSELHADAMDGNARRGVTGILLYRGGCFMQLLEGEEAVVRRLMASIAVDTRHKDVQTLIEGHRDDREFHRWSMGFVNMDRVPSTDRALFKEPLSSPRFAKEPQLALRLLESFKDKAG